MKIKALFILLALSLGSCSTLFNKKNQIISITTNTLQASVKVNDSTYQLPAKVIVERSKKDLPIELVTDSITKKYLLKPSINGRFLFGNLLFLDFFPIGYITDFTNQRRFSYQKNVSLDIHDSTGIIKTNMSKSFDRLKYYFTKEYPAKKGQINLIAGLPWINSFHLEPVGEPIINKTGIIGISTGIEYFYSNKNYFGASIRAVTASDFIIGETFGEYERMYSVSYNLTHNHKINRFSVGYGLNYTQNTWTKHYENYYGEEFIDAETINKTNKSFGLTLNGYYQISSFMYLGLNYNQSILNINPSSGSSSEHIFSFDFVFKFSPNKHKLP